MKPSDQPSATRPATPDDLRKGWTQNERVVEFPVESAPDDAWESERVMRALAYHAALLTHLLPGYDSDCYSLGERADALLGLIRDYADDARIRSGSEAASAELLSRLSEDFSS